MARQRKEIRFKISTGKKKSIVMRFELVESASGVYNLTAGMELPKFVQANTWVYSGGRTSSDRSSSVVLAGPASISRIGLRSEGG